MSGIARMRSYVLDCTDPRELADFYASLLGWRVTSVEEDWVVVQDEGGLHRLCAQAVEAYNPPEWPGSEHPQQAHLDLTVDDLDAAERAALEIGARRHSFQPGEQDGFRVFLDPAGHPFCLCL
jgi:predicted enzyme related to lactoylglutathione lyase